MARDLSWRRFLSAFYVLNAANFLNYFILRCQKVSPNELLLSEKRTFPVLLLLVLLRYQVRTSIDAYLAEVFSYIKIVSVILLSIIDYRLGLCMALWVVITSVLFAQPNQDLIQSHFRPAPTDGRPQNQD